MRILVLGADGYLGWPTAMYLSERGHEVAAFDNGVRRQYDAELRSGSLVPIESLHTRVRAWKEVTGEQIAMFHGDLCEADDIYRALRDFQPDAVVHFAEQRAAPYSMIDRRHAVYTQTNNVIGTLNLMYAIGELDRDIHIVKLGTMGEYGTAEHRHRGGLARRRAQGPPRPRAVPEAAEQLLPPLEGARQPQPRVRLSDLGPARHRPQPGHRLRPGDRAVAPDPRLATRFDYDSVFGTVLNRFAIQAVLGLPLSIYGGGTPDPGSARHPRHRRVHPPRLRESRRPPASSGSSTRPPRASRCLEMAKTVQNCFPGAVEMEHVDNPRVEAENHYYSFTHTALESLGLEPHLLARHAAHQMFGIIEQHRDRVDLDLLAPTVRWRDPIASARS